MVVGGGLLELCETPAILLELAELVPFLFPIVEESSGGESIAGYGKGKIVLKSVVPSKAKIAGEFKNSSSWPPDTNSSTGTDRIRYSKSSGLIIPFPKIITKEYS